ncbi:MAG: hypothetical protein PHE15_00065 [Dehalococcoidales bacterium]|nr:hypothetical protein [Dehalococcoidales bacterium]
MQSGDKFGRLTAIKYMYTGKHWRRYILFRCDCGKEKILQAANVSSGNTKSCGCLGKDTRAATALPGSLGAMRQVILQNYKRQGEHSWSLSEQEYYNISQENCYYCGSPPTQTRKGQGNGLDFTYNGLDRLDSSKGYLIDNVVPCCRKCNIAKNDMSIKEFYDWVKSISAMAEQWGGI